MLETFEREENQWLIFSESAAYDFDPEHDIIEHPHQAFPVNQILDRDHDVYGMYSIM